MISVDEARAQVLSRTPRLPAETVSFNDSPGRVLRSPVRADRDLPPFNRAAMDGFAVRSMDVVGPETRLRIVGEVRAGSWPDRSVGTGEAIRIMTGAPVPDGADAVVQVERTRPPEDSDDSGSVILLESSVAARQNVVARGSEAMAGDALLSEGVRITPAHLAVMASVGVVGPAVSSRPRVVVIVTGDEVVDPAKEPTPAQIRNANGPALIAAINEAGAIAVEAGIVADEPEVTRSVIDQALSAGYDAIVLSGGVSAGDFDFVESTLASLNVTLHVTAVRVKPGAPFVFGTRETTLVFGLPGNPVSAQVTFELFVRPALLTMQGALAVSRPVLSGKLRTAIANRSGRTNYLPVVVKREPEGLMVEPVRTQGSGDIVAHATANALAILSPEQLTAAAGETVSLYPLASFLES